MDTKKLRQKILDLAIHGKLVPQDPNDEPASVLLERIRAEKEMLIKEGKIKAPKKSKSAGDTSHYPKDVPFEVPEGWVWTTIGDILINRDGERIPVSSAIRKKQNAKLYDYYGAAGVIDKVDDYLFNERLLLVGEDGANLLSRSKDNAFFAEGKYWVNNHAHIIDASDKRLLDYIALYINAIPLDMYVTGSAQPKLNQDNLNRISVPLPPLAEQFRIVQAVEECKRIVNGIENNQIELQEAIDQTKQKILRLAIAGKLVSQDPSDEPAIVLMKRINPAFQASDNLHYLDCPSGWAVTQMKSIIELLSGRDLDNSRCNSEGYGVPYLVGASCIDKGRINTYRWTETPEVISKEGDILLSCKGTVGEVVLNTMGNLHIARQFMAIRSKAPQYILPDYLGIIIKASIETLKKAARGIIPGISREDILGLTVMIPPSEEQQRILSRIAEFNQSVSLIVANTCN